MQQSVTVSFKYFNNALKSYDHLIQQENKTAELEESLIDMIKGQIKIGNYYLSAIVYQYLLLFVKETESFCQETMVIFLEKVKQSFGMQKEFLNRLVYKIFFYQNIQLIKGFIEEIRIILTQIRYSNVFNKGFNKKSFNIENLVQQESKHILQQSTDSHFTQSTTQEEQVMETKQHKLNIESLNIEDLQTKLNRYCNFQTPSLPTKQQSVEQYMNSITNARTQMSQLCHQLGFNQPSLTKTAVDKLFKVKCKFDITGHKCAQKDKPTQYQQYSVQANSKNGAKISTQRLLKKLYTDHPLIWQSFKNIKKSKKIKT